MSSGIDTEVSIVENVIKNSIIVYANTFYIINQLYSVGFIAEDTGNSEHIGSMLYENATMSFNMALILLMKENNVNKYPAELIEELEQCIQDYCTENTKSEFDVDEVILLLTEILTK